MPMDLSSPAAAMFVAKPPKPTMGKFAEDGFPVAYKPTITPTGVKANDINRRTDWVAKYGSK